MIGTIHVQDHRGDVMTCRARRQLRIGDEIELPDGAVRAVRRSRCWQNGRRWEQTVLVGDLVPVIRARPLAAQLSLPAAS